MGLEMPICSFVSLTSPVAILELKKWGGALRDQGKAGGQHKCLSCMMIFHWFED